ncbi:MULTISPECIES: SapB/AmfS family lanthipeptide [unclassified Actinomadura]|nr:SapB/AmfS family lanthipeptide [Actinomadura sp. KC216]TDB90178.1 SapB/AmfS family lantipeptide [Actinomadura sp. KC216]
MALLDLQGMTSENGGGGGNSSLSILCHSSHSVTICL